MKTRLEIADPCVRGGLPATKVAHAALPFEFLCDRAGTVVFGWVAPLVLYIRFEDGLSSQNGEVFANRIGALLADKDGVTFFCDASALKHYDLGARRVFVQLLASNRRKFSSMMFLSWAQGISPVGRTIATTLGDPLEILTDRETFERRLVRAAPLMRQTPGARHNAPR
jgi:hypothetical protein